MTDSLCDALLRHLPSSFQVETFYYSYIVNCVFNAFLSYTTIMLNAITITAIRKTSSLPKPLKTLLLSLAVSDLGVGLFCQPFYVALLIKALLQSSTDCVANTTFVSVLGVFCSASFLSILALTGDRFAAVQFHLRYREIVTHKCVVITLISIWVFSALTPLLYLWIHADIIQFIYAINGMVVLTGMSLAYFKIYFIVRRHKHQIHAQLQQVAQNSQIPNIKRLRKSASSAFYVYIVFVVCYFPHFCAITALIIYGPESFVIKHMLTFTLTVIFLNSTVNPIVYCWKIKDIRRSVVDTIRCQN